MGNNYNSIARSYDALSRIIFQNAIVKAQAHLIRFINDDDKVLIAGGGTGWILEKISELKKKNVLIVYVEKSSAMISLSQKRNYKNVHVEFVHDAIEDYQTSEMFDVILTAFLFDNFLKDKIASVFAKLDGLLKQNGIWLYADFINNRAKSKIWQKMLLKTMYLFFRLTANIETQQLIDMQPYFSKKYQMFSQQFFFSHFIWSAAYKKKIV
jgi:ubiquinone/menaquinone biosynthesis C-methylase UbiE